MPPGPALRPVRGLGAFTPILTRGSRCRIGNLRGYAIYTPDPGAAYLGVSVPRSRVPLATDRNRYKRIVRASAAAHREILIGLKIVVIVDGPPRVPRAAGSLHRNLAELWMRLGRAVARQSAVRSP
jgi:ribonuclease P protein component